MTGSETVERFGAWRRRVSPAALAVAGLVVVSTLIRFAAARWFTTPWIAPDEMVYGLIGESLWSSGTLEVNIVVHPMWVERQLAKWPECGQRERKWFSIEEAADKVDSADLRALIMKAAERDLAGFPKRAKA